MKNKYIDEIRGTVIPLPTPFNEDESIDHESLAKYVKFLADSGIPNVMTTVGTSRYNLLSSDEIKAVNETVVKAADGKMKTIVANPPFGRQEDAIEFAEHSKAIGADLFLAYYPERFYGEEYLLDFFGKISDAAGIGVLIHEMPMRNGLGGGSVQYPIETLHKLFDIPNVVGLKEEALDIAYSGTVVRELAKKAVIIGAGGGMSRYLRDYWTGAQAFLGGIGNFQADVELDFFNAMQTKNYDKAYSIVHDVEIPLFQKILPFGWHPSLKAILSLRGHMKKYERKPMKESPEEERIALDKALKNNGW
ncbi:MAG: hypothetical protein CMP59_03930 [Flavobacteriales bacterium]|nr:hypothetical protein [Flavobacteriales bacterium]